MKPQMQRDTETVNIATPLFVLALAAFVLIPAGFLLALVSDDAPLLVPLGIVVVIVYRLSGLYIGSRTTE